MNPIIPGPISSFSDLQTIEQTPIESRNLPETSYHLLVNSAKQFGDKIALRFLPQASLDETSITFSYHQLLEKVHQTANAFYQLGIAKDDVVSMLLPNLPQTHFTLWGGEAAGIINPVNPLLEVEHIVSIVDETRSQVLVTLAPTPGVNFWEKALEVKEKSKYVKYLLVVNPSVDQAEHDYLSDSILDFDSFIAKQATDKLISGRDVKGTDIASYFHTGGTTGTPKLAPHTHFNEIACCLQVNTAAQMHQDSHCLCGLPLFHVNAVFLTGLGPWMVGAEVIIATAAGYRSQNVIRHFWDLVERYRITFFSAVPTVITALNEVPMKDRDISSLEVALCGASPLATELIKRFEASTGLSLLEAYGQTEGCVGTTCNPIAGKRMPGSVGLPLPYVKVRIVDVDQNGNYVRDCDTNEAGCVVISGPNVFSGYAKAQHNIGQWVEEGWFNTGDLGRLDENGYLWLTGRSKDIIIRGGHNIDPQMIEEAYYKHPQVNEAVAIGKPDIRVGELPIVYLQVKDGCKLSAQDFIEFGKSHIPERAAVPKEVHFIDQVPVTAVGKVFKPTLRDKTTLEVVQHELSLLNIEASDVSVEQDKQYGQCVHIHCDRSEHSKIEHQIGQYAFKLCLYP